MAVINILSNGKVLTDITGHIVGYRDNIAVYDVISTMEENNGQKKDRSRRDPGK